MQLRSSCLNTSLKSYKHSTHSGSVVSDQSKFEKFRPIGVGGCDADLEFLVEVVLFGGEVVGHGGFLSAHGQTSV